MRERLYHILVNRVPGIRSLYLERRRGKKGIGRAGALLYLLWLNIRYYVLFHRGFREEGGNPGKESVSLYTKGSESSTVFRLEEANFAQELSAYEVVSFDVFDTLLFRPFSDPADLFYLVGMQLQYPNFRQIRMEAEALARLKKVQERGTGEVTLEEIWKVMEAETGIPAKEGMRAEWEWEKRCCFANPYMKSVAERVRKAGRILVAASDMYLGRAYQEELLRECGYGEFDAYFVSCDWSASKSEGSLYDRIRDRYGKERPIAHVGDQIHSDGKQARAHRIHPFVYRNVNEAGNRYRTFDMSFLAGSLYRGMVNVHLYHSPRVYSREYEYGYVYGGLFAVGYCRFLHSYARSNGVDKLLFLSRDGYVLLQVYRKLYPREKEKTVYAYWSRMAAAKLCASYYKRDYFERFLYHKVNQDKTLGEALEAMDLSHMLDGLCRHMDVARDEKLTHRNVESVKRYLVDSWEQIMAHYGKQNQAARQYYGKLLKGCKSALAVDIGWAGSGALALHYAVNHLWGLSCRITGAVAGTSTLHSPCADATEPFLFQGDLVSYLYSSRENRDLWKFHDPAKNHNLYWELLLGADHGSLKGFYPDEKGGVVCTFRRQDAEGERILEIHRGILDFAEDFLLMEKRIGRRIEISGRDAYAPVSCLESEKNKHFMEYFEDLMDEPFVG